MSSTPVRNRLLESLPTKAFKRLFKACEFVEITSGDILSEPGERIRDVYFPTNSFVSLVARAAGNMSLEVALVGNEGMIGIPLMLGADTKSVRALVQQSGKAWRMKANTFKRLTDTDGSLRRELGKYVVSRLTQIGQNAICANVHSIEARFARRLLMMQDRSHSDQFFATHESLASMLGVRRSSVTLTAISIQQRNIIDYHRGTLTVLDRKGLEKLSCECYSAVPAHSDWTAPKSIVHAERQPAN